ncbi:glycosyltransferase family 2 protein [Desulfofustis glycolicus]|uniref:glycosyltransferase family 2 protein n=1 Tax=Desulfofustis glycolicus TaxID=51195 RepID=UPI001ABF55FD|nr:glycosyltransferase family 2 protein [Desulfofustis glycolicus]
MIVYITFYFSLLIIFYSYVGYPFIVFLVSRVVNRTVHKAQVLPNITILISAYNEESVLAQTIENKLSIDYPSEKREIIVISDGSTDKTDDIVGRYKKKKVTLFRQTPRAGKTSALNMAVPKAGGDIIVFADANSLYDSQALKQLAANFADPEVGYVTGKMIYTEADGTISGDGCSAYMKYENSLRSAESRLGSIVGVDGGVDAMRKRLYRPMKADQLPDFVQPLMVVQQGYRVVYEPAAILQETALRTDSDEYLMRVRVALRALWALFDMRALLFCPDNMLFSWQLWSHKVLRYLCFIFLLSAFISNLFLVRASSFYLLTMGIQSLAYLVALSAPLMVRFGNKSRLIAFIRYFALLNLACGHAFIKFISGKKQVIWAPRKG